MAKSVSVAVGDRETTHDGAAVAARAVTALVSAVPDANRAVARTRVTRLNMGSPFRRSGCGRRMEIRTTAPYLESCLSLLPAAGDLARWASHEGHSQLRDSVGISPTSLPRGNQHHIPKSSRESGDRSTRFGGVIGPGPGMTQGPADVTKG